MLHILAKHSSPLCCNDSCDCLAFWKTGLHSQCTWFSVNKFFDFKILLPFSGLFLYLFLWFKIFQVGKQRLLLRGCLLPPSPSEPSIPCSAGKWIDLGKEMSKGKSFQSASGMVDELQASIIIGCISIVISPDITVVSSEVISLRLSKA